MKEYYTKLLIHLFISFLSQNGLSDKFVNNVKNKNVLSRVNNFFKKDKKVEMNIQNVIKFYLPYMIEKNRTDFINTTLSWDNTYEGWNFWYNNDMQFMRYLGKTLSKEHIDNINKTLKINLLYYRC